MTSCAARGPEGRRGSGAPVDLVTGAGGFIGRHLVARLLGEGGSVRALAVPGEEVAAGAEVVRGDLRRPASLAAAVRGVERIYHLAAVVGDWGPVRLFQAVNVEGTRHLLAAAAEAGARRVVVVSSVAVYGWHLHRRVCSEDGPRGRGLGVYSRSKLGQEDVAMAAHREGRVPVVIVRPGNVYGPGSRHWVDLPLELLGARRMMLVDRGAGDAVLCWVDNLVDLLLAAGRAPGAAGRIYNANDDSGVTWATYMGDLARLAGLPGPRVSIPAGAAMAAAGAMEAVWRAARRRRRPLITREAVALLASRAPVPIARARSELGFSPRVSYRESLARLAHAVGAGDLH